MATIKSYTDLSQSKTLSKILPNESADMYFPYFGDTEWGKTARFGKALEYGGKKDIPCWSLASLLDVLPEGTRLLKSTNISSVGDTKYHCDCPKYNIDEWFNNPVDACYQMIIHLNELILL